VCVCVCVCVYKNTCVCSYKNVCVCSYKNVCVCSYKNVSVCAHKNVCVCAYNNVCVCVQERVCYIKIPIHSRPHHACISLSLTLFFTQLYIFFRYSILSLFLALSFTQILHMSQPVYGFLILVSQHEAKAEPNPPTVSLTSDVQASSM
jgi:hypothetical protein